MQEAERECAQRHRVYRRLVAKGTINKATADRQLAVMLEIAADYRSKVAEGPLFNREA